MHPFKTNSVSRQICLIRKSFSNIKCSLFKVKMLKWKKKTLEAMLTLFNAKKIKHQQYVDTLWQHCSVWKGNGEAMLHNDGHELKDHLKNPLSFSFTIVVILDFKQPNKHKYTNHVPQRLQLCILPGLEAFAISMYGTSINVSSDWSTRLFVGVLRVTGNTAICRSALGTVLVQSRTTIPECPAINVGTFCH